MEITKTVTVTIRAHGDKCTFACKWMSPPLFCGGRFCNYFHVKIRGKRCPECLAEFGTGEKTAVVPWEESNIGDVIEIDCEDDGKHNVVVVNCDGMDWPDRCARCACGRHEWSCPSVPDDAVDLCSSHPSGCDVYFTEVKE